MGFCIFFQHPQFDSNSLVQTFLICVSGGWIALERTEGEETSQEELMQGSLILQVNQFL